MSYELHLGDCREVMAAMPANSVDSIICDPPYMLNFMGKAFDRPKDNPAASVEVWAEALRVAKPGAYLLAFGGDRTHHRLMVAIEDAGWQLKTCLYWIFGSGFPKSTDISKQLDKAAGAEREVIGPKMRPDGKAMIDARPNGFKGSHEGWDRPWKHDRDSVERQASVTAPATDAAKQFSGYGTALKPAAEIIVMAMKPLDTSRWIVELTPELLDEWEAAQRDHE